MATVLNFSITQSCNCKTLTFKEITGAYDATTNTTGWGSPNEATSDATAATLKITPPGGSATTLNLFTSSFPTTTTTQEYSIAGSAVTGVGEDIDFPSGLYEFVYTVTTSSGTYVTTKQVYLWCTLKCCVDKLFANIDYDNCACDSDQFSEALTALGYLRGLTYHANVGNHTEADNIKTKLSNLCSNSKYCNNCG